MFEFLITFSVFQRKSPFNNEVASIPKTFQFQSDMVNQASMEYFQVRSNYNMES